MKALSKISLVLGLALFLTIFTSQASAQQFGNGNGNGYGFVDANGDGINDNAIDSDGDGIPNCQDPDYVRPQDGTGQKFMKGKANQFKSGKGGFGPANGSGNQGIGPKDGTGYGAVNVSGNGTGVCDGTGPKGKMNRGGRK